MSQGNIHSFEENGTFEQQQQQNDPEETDCSVSSDSESEQDNDTNLVTTALHDLTTYTGSQNTLPTSTSSDSSSSNAPSISSDQGRMRSKSNADYTAYTNSGSHLPPRSQRVWELDRHAPECRRCHRRFNFLVRRHHCR